MGRHAKTVISSDGFDRRRTGYYSTPKPIANYLFENMTSLLPQGKKVLDPCVGKEELIEAFVKKGFDTNSFDIHRYKSEYLSNFREIDFLRFYLDHKTAVEDLNLDYDFYIANPPYNCHEDDYIKSHKLALEKNFQSIGTLNMYSMFLYSILDLAKEGAIIGLITMDSFLTSFYHFRLRKYILENFSIHHLLLCPTDLFADQDADVRTCILILQKGIQYQKKVILNNRDANQKIFFEKIGQNSFKEADVNEIILQDPKDHFEIVVDVPEEIRSLFKYKRLGELFPCVTGISTGNDSLYLSKNRSETFDIPFYKNPGNRKFHTDPDCFLTSDYVRIGAEIKNFIIRNKKYIGREGITCSSIGIPFSAAYLPMGSSFGVNANVFPENKDDIWWLLSYLNSGFCTYMVRSVLIRTNMITSGYVSRIPVIEFTEEIKTNLALLGKKAYEKKRNNESLKDITAQIDEIIFKFIRISESSQTLIHHFNKNLIKHV